MSDYITAPVLAKKLGLKASTLARWRRAKSPTGPQGWVRYSATCVAYPVEEVEKWQRSRELVSARTFGNAA